jgi:hypothetical protein
MDQRDPIARHSQGVFGMPRCPVQPSMPLGPDQVNLLLLGLYSIGGPMRRMFFSGLPARTTRVPQTSGTYWTTGTFIQPGLLSKYTYSQPIKDEPFNNRESTFSRRKIRKRQFPQWRPAWCIHEWPAPCTR